MLTYTTKWKEISYESYCIINRGKSDLEILLSDYTSKEIKHEVECKDIPPGIGILNSIKYLEKNRAMAKEPDDYNYYKNIGTEMIFMGGEESIKQFKKNYGVVHKNKQFMEREH